MKILLSILVITVATVPMVSSRAVLPLWENQVRSHGVLKRVDRDANSILKSLETAAQDYNAECRSEYCEKLEELKEALLAIVENLTCPDEPEEPSESYSSSNDIDLGLIDL